MKIIGAVMIVSGCFLGGRGYIRTLQNKQKACETLRDVLGEFKTALLERRCSFKQYMDRLNPMVLEDADSKVRDAVIQLSEQLPTASYEESCSKVALVCMELEKRCQEYGPEVSAKEKAIPLVAGCLGFLVAVLLF